MLTIRIRCFRISLLFRLDQLNISIIFYLMITTINMCHILYISVKWKFRDPFPDPLFCSTHHNIYQRYIFHKFTINVPKICKLLTKKRRKKCLKMHLNVFINSIKYFQMPLLFKTRNSTIFIIFYVIVNSIKILQGIIKSSYFTKHVVLLIK